MPYTGTLKRGYVTRTAGQKKWHVSTLDEEAIDAILWKLKATLSLRPPFLSEHLTKKIAHQELTIDTALVIELLTNPELIEYNETPVENCISHRALLRNYNKTHDVIINGKVKTANICIVIDLDSAEIVTAYWNLADDAHDTIDFTRYETSKPKIN